MLNILIKHSNRINDSNKQDCDCLAHQTLNGQLLEQNITHHLLMLHEITSQEFPRSSIQVTNLNRDLGLTVSNY